MEENKFKQFFKNNFIYFLIGFACLAYIAFGMINIETSGRTILEIIGSGIIIFFVSFLIIELFSLQGMLSGDRKEEVIKTNKLHSKCVAEIDSRINELDEWCNQENIKTLETIRKQILNSAGLRYEDCFDENGTAKDVSFPNKEYTYTIIIGEKEETFSSKKFKKLYPDKYKTEKNKIDFYNEKQKMKRRAFAKAIKTKITLLSVDAITSTSIKNEDPHYFGIDRKSYQKKDARSGLISRAIWGIVFAYFTFNFVVGWAYLISSLIQVALFLLAGGIKFIQSYYFVVEDLRRRTIKQINYMQKFKCDKGITTPSDENQKTVDKMEDKHD